MSSDVRKADNSPYGRMLKYSVDDKLTIINYAKSHGNRAAGREFNVAESSIREWRKNENKLIQTKNWKTGGVPPVLDSPLVTVPSATNNNNNNNNTQKSLLKARELAQYASLAMMNIDLNLSHMVPILQLQQKLQKTSVLVVDSESTAEQSSSSPSSSTPPLSTSPGFASTSGSGRRKLRFPQKIVSDQEPQVEEIVDV
uniref:Brinker DNA-binding domain-containing protein n=1 Tax=Caenorhabditis japonica TaxID=281687 RepID=A0A2Q4SX54_CAEJA